MSKFDQQYYLPYETLNDRLNVVKNRLVILYFSLFSRFFYVRSNWVLFFRLKKPLTLSEKVLYSHIDQPDTQEVERGSSYLRLRPDRVAMQDATAQVCTIFFRLNLI